jgi:hypothetical protein
MTFPFREGKKKRAPEGARQGASRKWLAENRILQHAVSFRAFVI